MNKSVHFSSATDQWATPMETFAALDREFSFGLDVCADSDNNKCARFYDAATDGLQQAWTGTCWMNPPYGRTIGLWVRKAYESSLSGATVVCLLPSRTDTRWWHDLRDEVRRHSVSARQAEVWQRDYRRAISELRGRVQTVTDLPPLLICAHCRGHGGGCPDCNDVGVGVPVDWLETHPEYAIVTDADGRRWAERKE